MWRFLIYLSTWNHNPGNKMVRCGVATVSLFFGLILFGEKYHVSADVFVAGLMLVLIFALLTLFFGALRVVHYCRRGRKADKPGH